MKINQHTKISVLIKENRGAIEAIASINKHFEKLRNPILRKILASRVTIADAAKIGNADVQLFYDKLLPLGFIYEAGASHQVKENVVIPEFYKLLTKDKTKELDVREGLAQGKDPFNIIMNELEQLPAECTLKLINTFEPIPLINILQKKGYEHYTVHEEPTLIYTYFKCKVKETLAVNLISTENTSNGAAEALMKSYGEKIKTLDVRNMEMPLPMITILNELEILPADTLLYVNHKKVPQFLLPEIQKLGYKWHINEISADNVTLLIYK